MGSVRAASPLWFLSGLSLLLASCGPNEKKRDTTPPEAGFVVLKAETVPIYVELSGRTAAYETSEVRPQVSGLIQARLFTEGSIVKAGQTLYRIDPSLYKAAVDQADANLASALANRESTQAKADRYRPLAQIEAVSKQDYTDAAAAAKQAVASVAQNRATLETARINLRFTRVPAPITGRIGRSLFTTGALVTANQADPLTTIQRLDPIYVDIQQSSAELLALRRSLASGGVVPSAATVKLTLEDGSTYPLAGTVEFAEAMVDPNTGSVTLRARFPNPSGLLLPGMYVRARLSQATSRSAILVPQRGLSRDAKGNATVMVVGAGNKAELRTVTAGQTVGDAWLVTSGLNPGDKVIVEGLGKVRAGQAIRPVPAGSPPQTTPPAGGGSGGSGQPASRS
ncbi:efflux RND transporter periplasmic adaptor subunit [Flavisphingomonas formosensis]|uniref:efflux RND transporter periplasmic adaptor subunit n=1 Tax=Flavisphingomonas formosensis TaxID=861534 RepID=UPI0012F82566|nr:efflux RND transporter periplasmic adaptor subunit [Sphingomonas formosensis]